MTTNHEELSDRFRDRLLALNPRSVLDVGCGAGRVVAACSEAGITAVGIESSLARLTETSDGAARLQASALSLPLRDDSVDWVTLRHVPHHLDRPGVALAEAWRVAAVGVLIAEPWYDPNLPSQVHGDAVDAWLKRQDRARGMFHAANHSAAQLLDLLPNPPARASVENYSALRARTAEDLAELARGSLAGNTPSPQDQRNWEQLLDLAREGNVTNNGTTIVCAWK